MGKGMRTPYIEGVATHSGPESCVGDPRGRSEALTGVRAGWVGEPRNVLLVRGADAFVASGRQHRGRRYRESFANPARSKSLCMHGVPMTVHRGITALALPSRPVHLVVISGHITHFADPHNGRSMGPPGSRTWELRACPGSSTAQGSQTTRDSAVHDVAFR